MWVWLASGGAVVVIAGVVLFLVLGSGSKFSKITKGMTAKEVTDLLGEPTEGDTRLLGVWFHPPVAKADLINMEKMAAVKEVCNITFNNGKVVDIRIINAKDAMRGGGPGF